MRITDKKIEDYCFNTTKPEPALLDKLVKRTFDETDDPSMITGRIEGRFLKLLVAVTGAKKILEIGTFTGYSALSMAEALPDDGIILTCEKDEKAKKIAESIFNTSQHGGKISILFGDALESLKNINNLFDLIFIDADKERYPKYYEKSLNLLKKGGIIIIDNSLWGGAVLNPSKKSDHGIDQLNKIIVNDERVENVNLPIRDGINIVRKI